MRILLLAVFVLVACQGEREVPVQNLANGKRLYLMYGCAACHGPEGRGDGPAATSPRPRDFHDRAAFRNGHNVESIATIIATGSATMPPFSYIPENERRDIAVWVHSLAAQNAASKVIAENAWVGEPIADQRTTAAYLTLRNPTSSNVVLKAATSPVARVVEIHSMAIEGDRMAMRRLEELSIPARGAVQMEMGGMHLMLIDLTRPLKSGEKVRIDLEFADGRGAIDAPVRTR